jgi:thiosulfate/3-mercaptopyruvate sulfurtransferase
MYKLQFKYCFILIILISSFTSYAQNPINWTRKQLMEPSQLADAITTKTDVPVIVSVGPGATIPNSIDVGMCSTEEGLNRLKTQLNSIAKNQKIVIYCGCCPFERCPNVRPAIDVLKQMNFTNYFLLNLPHNIKIDWIDQGYPVVKAE